MRDQDQKKVDAFLKKAAESKARAADGVVERSLGELVLSLFAERTSLSLDDVLEALEGRLAATPSAQGKCSPDQDVERLCLLAVRRRLDQLPTPGPTEAKRE